MLPLAAASCTALCIAAACCGRIEAAALRLTLLPSLLPVYRRYSYSILQPFLVTRVCFFFGLVAVHPHFPLNFGGVACMIFVYLQRKHRTVMMGRELTFLWTQEESILFG